MGHHEITIRSAGFQPGSLPERCTAAVSICVNRPAGLRRRTARAFVTWRCCWYSRKFGGIVLIKSILAPLSPTKWPFCFNSPTFVHFEPSTRCALPFHPDLALVGGDAKVVGPILCGGLWFVDDQISWNHGQKWIIMDNGILKRMQFFNKPTRSRVKSRVKGWSPHVTSFQRLLYWLLVQTPWTRKRRWVPPSHLE